MMSLWCHNCSALAAPSYFVKHEFQLFVFSYVWYGLWCVAVIQTHCAPTYCLLHRILITFKSWCIIFPCVQYLKQFVCHNYPHYVSWCSRHGNTWVATLALLLLQWTTSSCLKEETTLIWYLKAVHIGITLLNGLSRYTRVLTVHLENHRNYCSFSQLLAV